MHRRTPGRPACSGIAVLVLLALASTSAFAAWDLNLPVGVTPISKIVYDLHMLILWICVAIGIVVFGVMFISIVRHRKAAGAQAARFHHSTFAEIAWTIIPIVILVAMAVPATTTLIEMEDTTDADLTVKVTAYQWMWKYEYLEDGVTVYSTLAASSRQAIYEDPTKVENYLLEVDNPIVFPVDKKVRLLLTADDVIHAWWVPELGQKKDAIPGFINEIWTRVEEPGVYRGQCAELCGKDHGFMPIVVRAAPEEEYRAWVDERKVAQAEQAGARDALLGEDGADGARREGLRLLVRDVPSARRHRCRGRVSLHSLKRGGDRRSPGPPEAGDGRAQRHRDEGVRLAVERRGARGRRDIPAQRVRKRHR